jgi:hypothetical protein
MAHGRTNPARKYYHQPRLGTPEVLKTNSIKGTVVANKTDTVSKDTPKAQTSQAGAWFLKYPPFIYDLNAGLKANFERLSNDRNWGESLRRKRWAQCQMEEFSYAYGKDTNKLESWQSLCREVGISDPPESITKCKNVSRERSF